MDGFSSVPEIIESSKAYQQTYGGGPELLAEPTATLHDPTFVVWAPDPDELANKPPIRIYHKKSRNGCGQCRSRRVKCDEVHPICSNCKRHASDCVYPSHVKEALSKLPVRARKDSSTSSTMTSKSVPESREFIESNEKHLLELELLHRYMAETSLSLTVHGEYAEEIKYYWTVAIPRLAFRHPALLNAIYTTTALHLSTLEPDNIAAANAHQKYLGLTISCHRDDVSNLSKENGDAVCLTSTFIRQCAFAVLSKRELEPYTPPTLWMHVTHSSHEVWTKSWPWIKDDSSSISAAFLRLAKLELVSSGFERLLHVDNRKGLNHLIRCNLDDDADIWDNEMSETYAQTLSCIGGVKIAIRDGNSKFEIFRRLITLPMFIPKQFVTLVGQRQSRALVILCHYFALLTELKDFWWIGATGEREIRAIYNILPEKWLQYMAWPLRVLEEPKALTPKTLNESMHSTPEASTTDAGFVHARDQEYNYITSPFVPSNTFRS